MTAPKDDTTAPAFWNGNKVIGLLMAVFLALLVYVTNRTYQVEATVTANDRSLVEVRTDIRYMKDSLTRIESSVTANLTATVNAATAAANAAANAANAAAKKAP